MTSFILRSLSRFCRHAGTEKHAADLLYKPLQHLIGLLLSLQQHEKTLAEKPEDPSCGNDFTSMSE